MLDTPAWMAHDGPVLEIGFGLPTTDFWVHLTYSTNNKGVLCFHPPITYQINHCCSIHVFYSMIKAASIYSSIYFIAGSLGGACKF